MILSVWGEIHRSLKGLDMKNDIGNKSGQQSGAKKAKIGNKSGQQKGGSSLSQFQKPKRLLVLV